MFSKEVTIANLKFRAQLLQTRDPMGNVNLIRKIQRRIRNLSK